MRVGVVEEEGGRAGGLGGRAGWVYESVLVGLSTGLEASEVVERGQPSLEPLSLRLSLSHTALSLRSTS